MSNNKKAITAKAKAKTTSTRTVFTSSTGNRYYISDKTYGKILTKCKKYVSKTTGYITKTQREIAEITGFSLTTVNFALRRMYKEGVAIKNKRIPSSTGTPYKMKKTSL